MTYGPPDVSRSYTTREERRAVRPGTKIGVELVHNHDMTRSGELVDISPSGMSCMIRDQNSVPGLCARLDNVRLVSHRQTSDLGAANVRRTVQIAEADRESPLTIIGLEFEKRQAGLFRKWARSLEPYPYVTDELRDDVVSRLSSSMDGTLYTTDVFFEEESPDLLAKCSAFYEYVKALQQRNIYQSLYRVTLTSGLDHRITVFNPVRRCEQEMICFDSNSYLGLHQHPRVIEAVHRAIDVVGYGTPSSQVLGGTNRYLRELEQTISEFHGRQDTLVFSSGFSANIGTINALVRRQDLVVRDGYAHASIHDGTRASGAQHTSVYPHGDCETLGHILERADAQAKLIVTDGVFSMHGDLAPLPGLVDLARRHNARLMVDDAHATGVVGDSGRGIEEHFGLGGAADILMGTFSKAPGTVGGYVCGDRELIYYLRFYARSGMFTAALPAALCAGVTEAFRIMDTEPEHRQHLWRNVHVLAKGLGDIGYLVPKPDSAIIPVFIGTMGLMFHISLELFDRGIKCGNVAFPAVPRDESILRLTVNARHTQQDLEQTIDIFERLGKRFGLLHRSREELVEIGERLVENSGR